MISDLPLMFLLGEFRYGLAAHTQSISPDQLYRHDLFLDKYYIQVREKLRTMTKYKFRTKSLLGHNP